MACLIVSAAAAGFLWALRSDTTSSFYAALMTIFAVLMVFVVESLATTAERDLELMASILATNIKRTAEGIVISDEKARELDRIVEMLSAENINFREKLLSERVRGMDEARRHQSHHGSFPLDGSMS